MSVEWPVTEGTVYFTKMRDYGPNGQITIAVGGRSAKVLGITYITDTIVLDKWANDICDEHWGTPEWRSCEDA